MDPIEYITEQHEQILQTYQTLHDLAEPSWMEEKTSRYIKEKLLDAGMKVQTFDGHYGLVAEIEGKKQEIIAFRADMDALVQEVEGVVRPNHSCGHDAHSTMALYTALALINTKHVLNHTVRFIFQPAEEKAEGALKMIEEGVLKDVKFLGGAHLRPFMEMSFEKAAPVILHSSTASLKGVIKGVPAHAARPEEGNNPLEAASLLIQAIGQIRVSGTSSIKITELHGGEASNSIPETARFTFDLRAESNEAMEKLLNEAQHILGGIAKLTETEIESTVEEYSPAAIKHPIAIELAKHAIASILGEENVEPSCVSPGAEDFHFYSLKNPNLAATMIGIGCDLKPGLHHPSMYFHQEALLYGTKIITNLLLEADLQNWES